MTTVKQITKRKQLEKACFILVNTIIEQNEKLENLEEKIKDIQNEIIEMREVY